MIYKERYNIIRDDGMGSMLKIVSVGKGGINDSLKGLFTDFRQAQIAIDRVEDGRPQKKSRPEGEAGAEPAETSGS